MKGEVSAIEMGQGREEKGGEKHTLVKELVLKYYTTKIQS